MIVAIITKQAQDDGLFMDNKSINMKYQDEYITPDNAASSRTRNTSFILATNLQIASHKNVPSPLSKQRLRSQDQKIQYPRVALRTSTEEETGYVLRCLIPETTMRLPKSTPS